MSTLHDAPIDEPIIEAPAVDPARMDAELRVRHPGPVSRGTAAQQAAVRAAYAARDHVGAYLAATYPGPAGTTHGEP